MLHYAVASLHTSYAGVMHENTMKYIYGILSLCLSLHAGLVQADARQNARNFIQAYMKGDLQQAAKEIFCPTKYTPAKEKEKRNSLTTELHTLTESFGEIKSYRVVSDITYTTLMVSCGPSKDYESFKPIATDIIEFTHTNGIASVLKLYYIYNSGEPVLGIIGIGEVGLGIDALLRQKNKHDKLSK